MYIAGESGGPDLEQEARRLLEERVKILGDMEQSVQNTLEEVSELHQKNGMVWFPILRSGVEMRKIRGERKPKAAAVLDQPPLPRNGWIEKVFRRREIEHQKIESIYTKSRTKGRGYTMYMLSSEGVLVFVSDLPGRATYCVYGVDNAEKMYQLAKMSTKDLDALVESEYATRLDGEDEKEWKQALDDTLDKPHDVNVQEGIEGLVREEEIPEWLSVKKLRGFVQRRIDSIAIECADLIYRPEAVGLYPNLYKRIPEMVEEYKEKYPDRTGDIKSDKRGDKVRRPLSEWVINTAEERWKEEQQLLYDFPLTERGMSAYLSDMFSDELAAIGKSRVTPRRVGEIAADIIDRHAIDKQPNEKFDMDSFAVGGEKEYYRYTRKLCEMIVAEIRNELTIPPETADRERLPTRHSFKIS